MRAFGVLCLLAGLLAGPPVAVSAAEGPVHVVLTGSRTASTVVTFQRQVTVQNRTVGDASRSAAVSSTGEYAGYLLTDLSGRRLYTGVLVVRLGGGTTRRYEIGESHAALRGKYLLTLVASTRAEVKIPVEGLAKRVTYQPRTQVPSSLLRPELADLSLPTGSSARAAVHVTPRTFMFFSIEQRVTGRAGYFEFCVVGSGGTCEAAVYRRTRSYDTFLYFFEAYAVFTESVPVGAVRAGKWDVVMANSTTGVGHETRAFVLAVG